MSNEREQSRRTQGSQGPESSRRSQRPPSPSVKQVVAALIFKHDQILVCQRTRHQTMPLKWEFPGGKIEEGEQPRDALRRELNEELGVDATIGEEVARIRHEYKNGSAVELRFYAVREYKGELENRIFKDMRWAIRSELPSLDFLEADLQLVRELAEGRIARAT
jgi:8-oxo-dGTP diphosphatase